MTESADDRRVAEITEMFADKLCRLSLRREDDGSWTASYRFAPTEIWWSVPVRVDWPSVSARTKLAAAEAAWEQYLSEHPGRGR